MAMLDNLSKNFPEGVAYEASYDTTVFVAESIKGVVKTLIEAILLVIAVTYLFLGSALVPDAGYLFAIPVSLIGTFAIMQMTNFTINTVTLFGLILAIGIVVDDAILVIENVDTTMAKDLTISPRKATLIAMKEVTGPIITSTLVLLAVFIPIWPSGYYWHHVPSVRADYLYRGRYLFDQRINAVTSIVFIGS